MRREQRQRDKIHFILISGRFYCLQLRHSCGNPITFQVIQGMISFLGNSQSKNSEEHRLRKSQSRHALFASTPLFKHAYDFYGTCNCSGIAPGLKVHLSGSLRGVLTFPLYAALAVATNINIQGDGIQPTAFDEWEQGLNHCDTERRSHLSTKISALIFHGW